MQTYQQNSSYSVYTFQYQTLRGQIELHKNVRSFSEATLFMLINVDW